MERKELYYRLCADLSGTYIEIGTCWGGFAEFLLEFTGCTHLYCVDPYKKYEALEYFDALNTMTQDMFDQKFALVKDRLKKKYEERVSMLREESVVAASHFKDNSLAFIYIDGNHMYHAVLNDLEAWYSKVQPGGILAGDDVESMDLPHDTNGNAFILHEEGKFGCYGVHKALLDFQAKHPEFTFQLENGQFYWRKI